MLILHCERHGHPMLVGYRRIRGVRTTDDGTIVDWECYCGWRGSWNAQKDHLDRDR
jgi:hypothetical protein